MHKFVILVIFSQIILEVNSENHIELDDHNDTSKYYTAAVMEFNPPGVEFTDPQQIIDANLKEYIKWINEAQRQNVDILVFPEATLNYYGITARHELIKFAIEFPEDRDYYSCEYTSNTILGELSEAVSNASIYVLVNIVEVERCNESALCDDIELYNTNIVFDRNGCIVSRYRKFNLFFEAEMKLTNEAEMVTFDSDFGVTFGHFICFDILFKSPAYDLINSNISHILYSSMWFNTLPFLSSIQIQQSYAFRNNIVLLSAGANLPQNSNSGSGIFIGKHGAINSIISYRNESKMIVAKVPKDVNDDEFIPVKDNKPYSVSEMDNLKVNFLDSSVSYPLQEKLIVDENGITCDFEVNFTRLSIDEGEIGYNYRFVAFNGMKNYGKRNIDELYCAIIACENNDPQSCGKKFADSEKLKSSTLFHSIKVTITIDAGEDDPEDYLIMPSSLDYSFHPLETSEFKFAIEESDDETIQTYFTESLSELSDFFTFGIYGRKFDDKIDEEDDVEEEFIIPSTLRYENKTELVEEESDESESDSDEIDKNVLLTMLIYVILMIVLCIIAAVLVHRRLKDPYEHPLIVLRRKSEMQTA